MTTRQPTYTPPPAPPLPLVAPAPLAAPAPLTARELVSHLGATLGLWTGAGLVFYGAAQAVRLGWLGPWEWLGLGIVAPLVLGVVGAVPLWPVWQAWHAARLWQATQAAHLVASGDERLLQQAAYVAWVDTVLGKRADVRDPGPKVFNMGVPVYPDTVPPTSSARMADFGRTVDAAVARAGATVDRAVGRYSPPEDVAPPVDPGDTQRLPDYPALPATAYAPPPSPPSPYTGNMRALVECALQTGTCSGKQAKALGISDRQHRAACEALGALGILRHDEGEPWTLVEPLAGRLRRIWQDNGTAELHYWIEKHLVN